MPGTICFDKVLPKANNAADSNKVLSVNNFIGKARIAFAAVNICLVKSPKDAPN